MENRKDFFKNEFVLERAEDALEKLATRCTLSEVLWIARNITYDQVAYYDKDNKGILYNGKYSNIQIEQATNLQRRISEACDLFEQIIENNRTFENEYLDRIVHSETIISNKNQLIHELETKIKELENERD